jgi:retinol dehydrogenase 12
MLLKVYFPKTIFYLVRVGLTVCTGLEEQTGFKAELWSIDLGSFESVKAFADKFDKDAGRLDIVVQNASTTPASSHQTTDGWESTYVSSITIFNTFLIPFRQLPN